MSSLNYTPLLQLLDREAGLQKSITLVAREAMEAAGTRSMARLEPALRELETLTRRAQAMAGEREYLIQAAVARGARARTLRAIAEMPGAPRGELLAKRDTLVTVSTECATASQRLQILLRELGDIYDTAVRTLVLAHHAGGDVAAAAARTGQSGSFINREV